MLPIARAGMSTPLLFQRVRVLGLNAKPEYNGRFGKAVEYVEASGRYAVMLEGTAKEKLALKPSNLIVAAVGEEGEICAHCGKAAASVRCMTCFAVSFCDKSCQEQGGPAHKAHCKPPPIGEFNSVGRATTEEAAGDLTAHLEASIRSRNKGEGGADQEIRMLKQALAADPSQPSAWFNLAMAYHEKGAKAEAVAAMDRAVFYMLQVAEPGAVDLDAAPGMREQVQEMMVSFVHKGGKLLEEAAHGAPEGLQNKEALATRLLALKEKVASQVPPMTHALVHYVYGEVLRKGDTAPRRALEQYELAVTAALPQVDAISLQMSVEMRNLLAIQEHPARSEGQRAAMQTAVQTAKASLAKVQGAYGSGAPQRSGMEISYLRTVGNWIMLSCDEQGQLQADCSTMTRLAEHAREAKELAMKYKQRGGREGAQAAQMLPRFETIVQAAAAMPVDVA